MSTQSSLDELPVLVVGAGPVGLAAAAHLIADGLEPLVLEAAETVAGNVEDWAHVRLFSPWRYNIDAAAAGLLTPAGWTLPALDDLPTGRELIDTYLRPLAEVPKIAERLRTSTRVTAISRDAVNKVNNNRHTSPFAVHVRSGDVEDVIFAKAVIDSSGTWATPNPLGASGIPASGEREASSRIRYGMPDVTRTDTDTYIGRTVLVVGSGHSAANVILGLLELAAIDENTRIHWAVRSALPRAYGGGELDQLEHRGAIGARVRAAVENGSVVLHTAFRVRRIERNGASMTVFGDDDRSIRGIEQIIGCTGQRPDLTLTRELRVDLDAALESTSALGPLIDPNLHSCGTVRPHDYRRLAQPDNGLYIAGAKSYGRAPTFLLATGYEQARSISAHLAGGTTRAQRVHLVLPETGVCSSNGTSECC